MSQRSEKLHRQVAQLRADVDALQVAWLSQQHCDAVELAAAAERTRQAHRRASVLFPKPFSRQMTVRPLSNS